MDGKEKQKTEGYPNAAEQPVSKVEAQEVAEKLKQEPQVVEQVSGDVRMLQKFALKIGKPMRVLAFAFSMLLAKEAMADEPKAAKVEHQELNLDSIRQKYTVPDTVKKLAEYEDPVQWYIGVTDQIRETLQDQNWKNLSDENKKDFMRALKEIPSGEDYAKQRDSESHLASMGYMQPAAKVISEIWDLSHYEPIEVAQNGK